MARRGLKKNPEKEIRAERLIEVLQLNAPTQVEKLFDKYDYRDIRRLPKGPAREAQFKTLLVALESMARKVVPTELAPLSTKPAARGRAGKDPGVSASKEAAAQRRAQEEAKVAGRRPRGRGSRRGVTAGAQVAEYTENIVIGRGYRGYSFEVEEIAPDKWDATITFEPIVSIEDGPTAKDAKFPATSDPDLLIAKVKERIDETLAWYADRGIQPRSTTKRKPTERRKTRRQQSRRTARIESERAEIAGEIRAERAGRAERFAQSYVQYGYDPDATAAVNIRNMGAKVQELRDEIRVTRDPGARRDLEDLASTIAAMVKRLKAGKPAFATARRGREEVAGPTEAEAAWARSRKGNPVKKPRRLTRKQLAALPSTAFALQSKRMFPVHTLAYVRVAMLDIDSAHVKGKISDADRSRAMKKAEGIMIEAVDRAITAEGNPGALPFKVKKNPVGRFFKGSDPAGDAGREWEKEYEKQLRKWMRSVSRENPDFVAMMEAYDAIELSRANYFLADDERKSKEMGDKKRELHEQLVELLEAGGREGLSRAVKEAEVVGESSAKSGSRRRSSARSSASAAENPTALRHGKTGRDYLKKADEYWDKYYNKGKSADLIVAYKYLTLAHEELKYAGDKKKLKEAKSGLNAATAELKLGLK